MLKPGFEKLPSADDARRLTDERESAANEALPKFIRAKVRLDYRGKVKPPRFFFGGKNSEEVAEELRQQQAALWRNVPVQGIFVENIQLGQIYSVFEEDSDVDVAYAPMELDVRADSLCQLVRFAVREEFRRISILEPPMLQLSVHDTEQIFFQVHEQVKTQLLLKAKRYQD